MGLVGSPTVAMNTCTLHNVFAYCWYDVTFRRTLQNISPRSLSYFTGIAAHGNKVLQPAVFTVETLEAGSGEVLVYVEDPEGHKEEARYT